MMSQETGYLQTSFRLLHVHALFIPRAIRQANTVITIFGFTSTKSSGSAYTRAPIFLAMEMAYLPKAEDQSTGVWEIHSGSEPAGRG